MKTVNMREAKTHLSKLVEGALHGELFVIARAGKPVVQAVMLRKGSRQEPDFSKSKSTRRMILTTWQPMTSSLYSKDVQMTQVLRREPAA